ncbi:Pyr_redox_2 domain-containing protein [Caenorhabditis elegans]|nr:Pyr_redox_2 domain-containing protein [Caenorhabditis elegans]CDR32708.1 Pyr_redox_2 domain-containing protein [Caenorhabditis elegans]|eukprot:NP_001293941.1 Sulfide Quinone oxidoReDuctase [Caenorhabditis elegans]
MSLEANRGKQKDLIPKNATWIQDKVQKFEPAKNSVKLRGGDEITYDYMVIAMGVQLRYDMIKGAKEALDTPGVCSNYSPFYVEKHYKEAMNFKGGNALYTFPNTPIKCAGAPQKACYITDSILRQRGVRDQAHMIYATSLKRVRFLLCWDIINHGAIGNQKSKKKIRKHQLVTIDCFDNNILKQYNNFFFHLFGIESYLKSLEKVARDKEIDVRTRRNLIEVNTNDRIATFELLDEEAKPTGKTEQIEYSLLHIGPPCSTPEALRNSAFVDKTGFMDVDGGSLQSKKYPNVFGVGDCMNTPNAKTAAAVSSHLKTIEKNLTQVMQGNRPCMQYDGYASCPLVVSTNRVILAEFGPRGAMETTPFDQSKPTYWAYLMKRYFMPALYWNGLIKGYWNGPATLRNCTRLVKSK